MTDDEFLAAFERCALAPIDFGHVQHARAAFLYLERKPFGAAIDAMSDGLRRFAASLGRAERYHETLTVAFMALVNARRRDEPGETWESFAERNPDLLRTSVIGEYYSPETLASGEARRRFTLERRSAGP